MTEKINIYGEVSKFVDAKRKSILTLQNLHEELKDTMLKALYELDDDQICSILKMRILYHKTDTGVVYRSNYIQFFTTFDDYDLAVEISVDDKHSDKPIGHIIIIKEILKEFLNELKEDEDFSVICDEEFFCNNNNEYGFYIDFYMS